MTTNLDKVMNYFRAYKVFINAIVIFFFTSTIVLTQTDLSKLLKNEFELTPRIADTSHNFIMETKVIQYAPDGKRKSKEIFKLFLHAQPLGLSQTEYCCTNFLWVKEDSSINSIPAMEGWTYIFDKNKVEKDENGPLFGIDHSQFENLKDEKGNSLGPEKSYFVYNTFIDFHSICDVFAGETKEGKGIQNLRKIGQNVIHSGSFSEPPVNLGSQIKEGSKFKNGEITLILDGISEFDSQPCAIVRYNSGESSFKMMMEPIPKMIVTTVGSSHYFGNIYIDLETKWVRKADLSEFVVTEINIPGMNKINAVTERELDIRMIE